MAIKATLAASVQKKNGRLHAVIQVKEDGKTKSVWRALGLPEGASQTLVNKAFRKVVTAYEEEYNKRIARGGRPDADIPIFPFLCAYLEQAKPRLQLSTYKGYHQMAYSRVQEYFNAHPKLTVESIADCGEHHTQGYRSLLQVALRKGTENRERDPLPHSSAQRFPAGLQG